jgi:superfamily I DNA and/or RNA helicase/tRNA A-37 threonylcarbamoyl transferase component Bud32
MENPIPLVIDDRFAVGKQPTSRPGGMGEVYKATDLHTQAFVALKMLKEDRMPEIANESWSREVKSLQTLEGCENIVGIIDVGRCSETGRRYIALEWVEHTLASYMGDQVYDWDKYYNKIGQPILNGLSFAFKNGIYHRDIKPDNILISDEGIVKVVDFGIAQFAHHFGSQQTLVLRGTEPFAPPWLNYKNYQQKRDIYSFAVLSLCLVNPELVANSDLDVQREILDLNGPAQVRDYLSRCLSDQPDQVPESIIDVFTSLEVIQGERYKKETPEAEFFVHLTLNAIAKAPPDLQSESESKTIQKILEDLNRGCVYSYRDEESVFDQKNQSEIQFQVCTDDYVYDLRPSNKRNGALVVVSVFEIPPQALFELRQQSWAPTVNVRFNEVEVPGREITKGKKTIAELQSRLWEHRADRQKEARDQAKFRPIQIWRDRVRLQREQLRNLVKGLRYTNIRSETHSRAIFELDSDLAEDEYASFYDESFTVVSDSRFLDAGTLEFIEGNEATVYFERTDISSLPQSGELKLSQFQNERSLDRQDQALEAIQHGFLPKRGMTQALLSPDTCLPPEPVEISTWFQSDLDDDKKHAVQSVLGASDISVIEGPPGTGKTKLIAEIILQYQKQNPDSKILLASQTNIAVDHALAKVSEVLLSDNAADTTKLHMVRLGDPNFKKIAASSEPYLMGRAIETWRDQGKVKSQEFLEAWAESKGIDRQNIQLGIGIRDYANINNRLKRLEEDRVEVRGRNDELKEKAGQAFLDGENRGMINEINREIESNQFELTRLKRLIDGTKKEKVSAEKKLKQLPEGKEYLLFGAQELDDWVEQLLPKDDKSKQFQNLYDIQQDWFARFQDSDDFNRLYLDRCELVVGTCIGIARRELQEIEFDLCIVDEASKASPGEAVVPLAKSKQWALVGDPKQLPPFVMADQSLSSILENYEGLEKHHLKESLLDHLLLKLPATNHLRLSKQYRMIKPIGDLVSSIFYDSELKSDRTESPVDLTPTFKKPVTWFSTSSIPQRGETKSNTSYANLVEANVVKGVVAGLLDSLTEQDIQDFSICLLSGYLTQVLELKRILNDLVIPASISIEACTVDTFQGREADVAIYSVTRSNEKGDVGFVRDKARLNVALSRARFGLGIVGDADFCRQVSDELLPTVWRYIQTSDHCEIVDAPYSESNSRTEVGRKPKPQETHKGLAGLANLIQTSSDDAE